MLSNILQSNRMRQARNTNANLIEATRTPTAVRPLLSKSSEGNMLRQDNFNTTETQQSAWQIVANAYTRLWDLFWLPIGLISKLCWRFRLFPEQWAPWLLGARFGRWPEKINLDTYKFCDNADCEICPALCDGEIDIDDQREIKHDPFGILSNLKQ
jgi:hypothetical protein